MTYTPVELRHVRVSRSLFGYNRAMVEQVIEEVADSFENVWRERGELTDQVHALEKLVTELRGREELLTHTLVAAEHAASEVREHAKRDADTTIAEAHAEARSIARTAQGERERLFAETRRIEALLRAALGLVQEGTAIPAQSQRHDEQWDQSPAEPPWPVEQTPDERREDTREFNPASLPPAVEASEGHVADPAERPLRQVVGGDTNDFDWGD